MNRNYFVLFFCLHLVCISLFSQVDIWGEYFYRDTLKHRYDDIVYNFESRLFLYKEDSSYLYTIQFVSGSSSQVEEVSSRGKVRVVRDSIYLRDTVAESVTLGTAMFNEIPFPNCFADDGEFEVEPVFHVLVPFDPLYNHWESRTPTVEWGIIFDGKRRKRYSLDYFHPRGNERCINPAFRKTIPLLKKDIEAEYFQIYRRQLIEYGGYDSVVTYSERIPMSFRVFNSVFIVYVRRNVFIPYVDMGWFIRRDGDRILLDRDRASNDLLFGRLKKVGD